MGVLCCIQDYQNWCQYAMCNYCFCGSSLLVCDLCCELSKLEGVKVSECEAVFSWDPAVWLILAVKLSWAISSSQAPARITVKVEHACQASQTTLVCASLHRVSSTHILFMSHDCSTKFRCGLQACSQSELKLLWDSSDTTVHVHAC